MSNLVTVSEYAKQKGITVQAVYQSIKRGATKSKKIGNFVFVELENKG